MTSHRPQMWTGLAAGAFVFLVSSAQVFAQAAECKATETQAECHARLKCKPYEELEDCKKRLKSGGGQQTNGNDRGNDGRGDDARGDDGRGDNNRGDNNRGRGDNGRGGNDRSDSGRGRGSNRGDDGRRGGRRGGRGGSGGRGFEANKVFGLGLELGEPTGLNGKYFLTKSGALDFGIGWIYRHYYYGDGLNIYGDYLFHPVSLASNPTFELPFYIGLGLRYWDFEYCDNNDCYGGSSIGLRIPLGLSIDFNNSPVDIFFQLVPTIDFARGDYYDRYRDRNHFGVDFSVGIRLWLK